MRYVILPLLLAVLICPLDTANAAEKDFVGRLAGLANPAAQERLKLSPEVRSKILAIIDERETGALELAQTTRNLSAEEREAKLAPYRAESEKLGLALLTPEQLKLLDQWEYDARGPLAFQDHDLAGLLKITTEQQAKIATAIKDFEANTPMSLRKGRQPELERQLLGVLTTEQKTTWGKLIGRDLGTTTPAASDIALANTPPTTTLPTTTLPTTESKTEAAPIESKQTAPKTTEAQAANTKQPELATAKSDDSKRPTPVVPAGEKRLKFSFKFQPWRDVIEWFAQQNDYSLVMEVAPPGTFNYQDSRSYTPAEALDLLNSILQTKGYTLVRRERLLMLVNLQDGIPPNLVESITPEELDKRATYELVSVLFRLDRITPDKAASEIRSLLGPQGSVAILNELRTIQVTDTVGRLRTVRNVIDAVERPANVTNDNFKPLLLKNITPADALTIVKQLLNIPADRSSSLDGSIRLFADNANKALLIGGKPESIAKVEEILLLVDVPNSSANSALEGAPQLEVCSIGAADAPTVLSVLQTLLSGIPDVRLSLDPRNGNLIALARPAQHATIRATIEQLQRDARQLEVFRLRMLDPTLVKDSIVKLYGDGNDPANSSAPKVEVDPNLRQVMIRGTTNQLTQIKQLLDKMGEGDLTAGSGDATAGSTMQILPLTPRAANSVLGQLEQIWPNVHKNKIRVVTSSQLNSGTGGTTQFPAYDLIQQKRVVEPTPEPNAIPGATPETNPAAPNTSGVPHTRTLDMDAAELQRLMNLLQNSPYRINPGPGLNPGPADRPSPVPQPETTPREEGESPETRTKPIKNRSAHMTRGGFQFVAHQAPSATAPAVAPAAPGTPATPAESKAAANPEELPPINISVGPAGLVISCEDPKVLEDFVSLVKTLASRQNGAQREYTVYYLKYAKAQVASELLNQIFSAGGSSSSSSSGGGLMNSLAGAAFGDVGGGLVGSLLGFGGGGGGEAPTKLSGSGTITIVPETRLNALFIQANPTDLEMLEQILKVIDQAQSPEDVTVINKPRLIPVQYTTAEEVAAVVKQVYADRMAAGAGGQQRQPNPEDFIRALRGGRGGGGGNDSRKQAEETQKMTIGIDTRTNSLVVTAPEPLFNEVKALVAQLDQEQPSGNETIRIVTLKNASPAAVQQALTQIVGPENLKNSKPAVVGSSTSTSGGTFTSTPRSNRSSNAAPSQTGSQGSGFDMRAMQQMMQGGGGGGRTRGGGGGFGGGGFGGGGRGR